MKIDRIAYEQLYPTGVYANQRLRAEATVDWEKDDIMECYKTLQSAVEKAFVALNPQIKWEEKDTQKEIVIDTKEKQIQNFIEAINTCTSLKSVDIFRKLVERENNEQLTQAFDKKFKSLVC
jgi:hypothetical protein